MQLRKHNQRFLSGSKAKGLARRTSLRFKGALLMALTLGASANAASIGQMMQVPGFRNLVLTIAALNRAMVDAAENPMDNWRRQNVQHMMGLMPLAITGLAKEFKANKLVDSDLPAVQKVLGGFVDQKAGDNYSKFLKNPDRRLIPRVGAGFPASIDNGSGGRGRSSSDSLVMNDTAKAGKSGSSKTSSAPQSNLDRELASLNLLPGGAMDAAASSASSSTRSAGSSGGGGDSGGLFFDESAKKGGSSSDGSSGSSSGSASGSASGSTSGSGSADGVSAGASGDGVAAGGPANPKVSLSQATSDLSALESQLSVTKIVGPRSAPKSSLDSDFFTSKKSKKSGNSDSDDGEDEPGVRKNKRNKRKAKKESVNQWKPEAKYWYAVPYVRFSLLGISELAHADNSNSGLQSLLLAQALSGNGGGGGGQGGGGGGGGGGSGAKAAEILFGLAAVMAAAAPMVAAAQQADADKTIAQTQANAQIMQTQISASTSKYLADNQAAIASVQAQDAQQIAANAQAETTRRLNIQVAQLDKGQQQSLALEQKKLDNQQIRDNQRVALAEEQVQETKQLAVAQLQIQQQQALQAIQAANGANYGPAGVFNSGASLTVARPGTFAATGGGVQNFVPSNPALGAASAANPQLASASASGNTNGNALSALGVKSSGTTAAARGVLAQRLVNAATSGVALGTDSGDPLLAGKSGSAARLTGVTSRKRTGDSFASFNGVASLTPVVNRALQSAMDAKRALVGGSTNVHRTKRALANVADTGSDLGNFVENARRSESGFASYLNARANGNSQISQGSLGGGSIPTTVTESTVRRPASTNNAGASTGSHGGGAYNSGGIDSTETSRPIRRY